MDSPAARASVINSLCCAGVALSATGLLRLSFAFIGGLPIFLLIQVTYYMYINKSSTILRIFFTLFFRRLSLPFQPVP